MNRNTPRGLNLILQQQQNAAAPRMIAQHRPSRLSPYGDGGPAGTAWYAVPGRGMPNLNGTAELPPLLGEDTVEMDPVRSDTLSGGGGEEEEPGEEPGQNKPKVRKTIYLPKLNPHHGVSYGEHATRVLSGAQFKVL